MHRSFSVQTHRHTHAELQSALDQTRQPAHTQAQSKKKKKIHKREDNTCTSGSEMRADEINPARMKGGEHPCDAGITHGEKLQKKKRKKKSSLPAQVDICSGFPSSSRDTEPFRRRRADPVPVTV